MKNLTLENITKACRGTFHGDESLLLQTVSDVVIDSRKVQKDNLFVAIDGRNVNAHQFIPDAIRAGALCVVSHEDLGETDFPYIRVESTGQALLDIAKFYRDSFDIKVVGITGSVGKTSTKEMVASVLSTQYQVHKNAGNFNNEWGLPLTIFGISEETDVAILEMGVNHFGEMRRLSSVASPDLCLITNIGIAHLEYFKTKEGIFQEKSQMIQDMKEGGTVLLNGDDPILAQNETIAGHPCQFYGTKENSAFYATDVVSHGLKGTTLTIHFPDDTAITATIPLPGSHMVGNALAGAAVGYCLDVPPEKIKAGIESLSSLPGRNHVIVTRDLVILDDCYNANPVSMKAALDVLSEAIGRKVAILGDMGELGADERNLHYETGVYAADHKIDVVIGVGPLSKALVSGAENGAATQAYWFPDTAALQAQLPQLIQKNDNVLVKASHAMNFTEIVEALQV